MDRQSQRSMSLQDMSTASTSTTSAHGSTKNAYVNNLPILISALNQHLELLGRKPNEKFQLKEFDLPMPADLFRRILTFLLTHALPVADSDLPEMVKVAGLKKMNDCGVYKTTILYNPSVDNLYWAYRRIFDFYDNLLDYHLLYFPYEEPKRVKYVLNFITTFGTFCDTYADQFDDVAIEAEQDIEEEDRVSDMLEEAKTKLNAKIVQLEEWKNEIPYLREQIRTTNEEIKTYQARITELDKEVKKRKEIYDAAEQKNISIQGEIESVQTQIRHKKPLVVSDGEALLKALANEMELLAVVSKDREELDVQQMKLTQTDSELGALTDFAGTYATELEEFVMYLQHVLALAEKKQSIKNEIAAYERKIKDFEPEEQKLKSQYEMKLQVKKHQTAEKRAERNQLKENLAKRTKERDDQRAVVQTLQHELNAIQEKLHKQKNILKEKKAEYDRRVDFIKNKGPEKLQKLKKGLLDALEVVNKCTGSAVVDKILSARNAAH